MKRAIGTLGIVIALLVALQAGPAWGQAFSPETRPGGIAATRPATFPATAAGDGPASRPATGPATGPTTAPASAPGDDGMVAVSFKDMSVEQLAGFLGEKLKKPVLMTRDDLKGKKLAPLVCKDKKCLADAMYLIRQALLVQGIVVDEDPQVIYIRPVEEVMRSRPRQVPAKVDLATLTDALEIVQKEFQLEHYDASKMADILRGTLPPFGQILVDPASRRLVVTDTVEGLRQLEEIVLRVDVPSARRLDTKVFPLSHADAVEIIEILRPKIAAYMGSSPRDIAVVMPEAPAGAAGRPEPPRGGPSDGRMVVVGPDGRPMSPPSGPSGPGGAPRVGPTVTEIKAAAAGVTLMPNLTRNWIIATAPPDILTLIETWVAELDTPREVEKDYELYEVTSSEPNALAMQVQSTLRSMTSVEVAKATNVARFGQSKKIIVFGSKAGRALAVDLLKQIDQEGSPQRTRRTFELKYGDAAEMASRIENLYSAMELADRYSSSYYTSTRYRRSEDAPKVTIVPDKRRNAITVITDAETMEEVAKLIDEEDKPIKTGDVLPKTYEIQYIDAEELKDLLTDMFSQKEDSGNDFWRFFWGSRSSEEEVKPIGRLLGQFSFRVLPSSNLLMVNATSGEYYSVIDELIKRLDQPHSVGVPEIVELNHANAEDLCEQLNAVLGISGASSTIRRADRGLTSYASTGQSDSSSSGGSSSSSSSSGYPSRSGGPGNDPAPAAGEMGFWWQRSGAQQAEGEVPTSNLIGKVRIVPVYQRNGLMVLAPAGYKQAIMELVRELDRPGRQVMIHARVGEIQHEDQTTLGLRIASDPSILGEADSAVGGALRSIYSQQVPINHGTVVLEANANIAALLNLLVREFDMNILMTPTITTSDNKASEYFDGSDFPIQTEVRSSAEGTSTVTNIRYQEVGTRIRVRPHITSNGNVDLLINLTISRRVPGSGVFGNPIFDRREVTTHVLVQDGQTVMLSGIVQQEDFEEVHKVPLLGDIPLIGKLFRSIDTGSNNRELVAFVTPCVMKNGQNDHEPVSVDAAMAEPLKTLHRVQDHFGPRAEPQARKPAEKEPTAPDIE